ncbi:mannose-6-phosphate isomerase [Sphingomonas oleivorans]|uniref:Mannose-6-phosphate isomerase n=2 Tax=Sphingomonas oleivorans TaxID=1735121 RepID=A0A2T5FVA4_9SPHN|nr:mannose-6-phosphate isomerase [Sphingomonas oleivorans]
MEDAVARTTDWLCNVAAPLWSTRGRTASGLFAERMTLAGEPDDSYFRTFVQARHVFSFCAIGRLGWHGPWRELAGETVETLLARARRPDGFFVHKLDAGANQLDPRADLYDQAFVLFALGTAGAALDREGYFDAAEDLLDTIERQWSHPAGGFTEGEIVDPRVRRQNPHMHLFEAAQALFDGSTRARFGNLSRSIAALASERMIDPVTGALLEYFNEDFTPAPGTEGTIAEPGHCFEWAWLFERLARRGWEPGTGISDRLVAFARGTGIDPERGVAINEVLTDGTVHDAKARLWPQTERIKAAAARLRRTGAPEEAAEAVAAVAGLEKYYDVTTPGLWRDKLCLDGSWLEELAPGSSLYHISCAYLELAEGA